QDDVEESDGHDRVRMLRTFRAPPIESASEIVPTSAPPARPASPVEGSPQLVNIPAVIGPPGGRRVLVPGGGGSSAAVQPDAAAPSPVLWAAASLALRSCAVGPRCSDVGDQARKAAHGL